MRSLSELEEWERAVVYSRVLFGVAFACLAVSVFVLDGLTGTLVLAVAGGALALAFIQGYRGQQAYTKRAESGGEV